MILKRKRLRDHFETLADYEGKLIRVARGEVFYVRDGKATSLNYLSNGKLSNDVNNPTIIDGKKLTWNDVYEVPTMPGDVRNTLVDLVSKIPTSVQTQLKDKATQLVNQGISNINPTDPSLLPYNAATKNAIQVANGMSTSGISVMNANNMYIVIAVLAGIALMIYFKK